jgi:hypothetical protein
VWEMAGNLVPPGGGWGIGGAAASDFWGYLMTTGEIGVESAGFRSKLGSFCKVAGTGLLGGGVEGWAGWGAGLLTGGSG